MAGAFFAASRNGDTAALRKLLAETATFHSDGGGRKPAVRKIITGADTICRLFAVLAHKANGADPLWAKRLVINGLPGCVTVERDGTLQTTALEIDDDRVVAIYIMRNPEKLGDLASMVPGSIQITIQSR